MRVQMDNPISIKTLNGGVRDIEVFLLILLSTYQRCFGQLFVQQKGKSTRLSKTFEYQMSLLKMMCTSNLTGTGNTQLRVSLELCEE